MMRWKQALIKVVFVIRKDLEKDFREVIGNRIEKTGGYGLCLPGA